MLITMNNKYTIWYHSITETAKARALDTYTERHHILPKSLGGTDDAENLVDLTAREHFICHWLLTKMTAGEDRYKMLNALRIMRAEKKGQKRYATKITARVYAHLKEEYAQLQSVKFSGEGNGFYGKHHTDETKDKIAAANTGRVQPDEEKIKQKAAITGRKRAPFSDEWIAKLSAAKTGEKNNRYGVEVTEETRAKQRAKAIGRKYSAEVNASKGRPGLKREKLLCPHCNKEVAVNGYARWHGDNCKKFKGETK